MQWEPEAGTLTDRLNSACRGVLVVLSWWWCRQWWQQNGEGGDHQVHHAMTLVTPITVQLHYLAPFSDIRRVARKQSESLIPKHYAS